MIEITVNGNKVKVPKGSNLIQATKQTGCFIPHFCYHKKLSVAANCRMCLVEVEKSPKVLPACSTIVNEGMVVYTDSKKVKEAQNSVIEFLLINHPLDCPVCDQGGECQLQDLSVGYGKTKSRYTEKEKRIVFHKNLGPLISAEEMSRCIHCTRCIRFGQEIAGVMELGMLGRGEKSEISTFLGNYVESELSGNMIDLCPVGALTSKPFRFKARTWELSRRKSISPHDSTGTNLTMQIKDDYVARVVPFENESINECWISDRDRFSYEGLNSSDRLSHPLFKDVNGNWVEISWNDALDKVVSNLLNISNKYGPEEIGAIASEYSTVEEFYLLSKLLSNLGSDNLDFRTRKNDCNLDNVIEGYPWLGMSFEDIEKLDVVLVVGSRLRNDHPLLAHRLRKAAKSGAKVFLINSYRSDEYIDIAGQLTVVPSKIHRVLAKLSVILLKLENKPIPKEFEFLDLDEFEPLLSVIAKEFLVKNKKTAILIGNMAVSLPNSSKLIANAGYFADIVKSDLGFLTYGANCIGGYISGFFPKKKECKSSIFDKPLKSYLILHSDPYLDVDNGAKILENIQKSEFSVSFSSYFSTAKNWANIILPVSPFSETSGTYINSQGMSQSFKGVVKPLGFSRPAWKIFCSLGRLLNFPGFDYTSSDLIKEVSLPPNFKTKLSNRINISFIGIEDNVNLFERIADVPIYRSDAILRASCSLQRTKASELPSLRLNTFTLNKLNLLSGDVVKVSSNYGSVKLTAIHDELVPDNGLYISATFDSTSALGGSFEFLNVEKLEC
ncbi:NADH-quinone oxidoreductase subunit NuoG [Candidatus Kinetoplastidibacterium desouzai]|nr:NADH-quinone oxidoreductase subunit NuoG [Candidatus Kinetoplastibacterium desouzaii]